MRARLVPGVAAPAALALALAASGCNSLINPESCHEIGATIQPLEPEMLDTTYLFWPPTGLTTTAVHVVAGPSNGYYTCQARAYVLEPIDRVYAALSVADTTYLHNDNGATTLDLATQYDIDPISVASVSFHVFYKNHVNQAGLSFDVKFDLKTWIGWLEGSQANPLALGLRTHKTCGTTHIQTMDGSIVSRPVAQADLPPGVAGATTLEMIYWLEADTQHQSDCNGTLQDQFNGIVGWLNTH